MGNTGDYLELQSKNNSEHQIQRGGRQMVVSEQTLCATETCLQVYILHLYLFIKPVIWMH